PGSTAYNMTVVHRLEGNLDKEKFAGSVKILIQRHETLRTSFQSINGQPVQRVHEEVEFEIQRHTASAVRHADIVQGFVRPFDLSK
ncbi:MAG: hypothetical protein GTO45_14575, partial [Candidatus Aminicenantes bacterium]|nr:hypothetical protein [Candidatus Aminicenantes bacterium]NIM79983.1 hypothetical protein [Candidatus Aminicenantes bacterium]NIN19332.1 hypothetical protein [Candidatus Aminicenantes bacterium]NIN43234.1 hypothetical protein [Candidatus Aminicenantes bacterium]NIN85973.1 hypothetical protein [Candidatus Aminicenantes bacterium]